MASVLLAPLLASVAAAAATVRPAPRGTPVLAGAGSVGNLSVFVGYAEDKETNNPDPAAFPVPWDGAPNTTFLGGPVPGQAACGTLTVCYDAAAIRLDNNGATPVTVDRVLVDIHSSIQGGKIFDNLWGSFTVQPGKSVILTENPPFNNPGYDNFDTSGYPPNICTPVTVAPTITFTIGGVKTTLADSTHVLDTGGIDAGFCKQNESIQWRPIGSSGVKTASLQLGPAGTTKFAGQPVTETATLLDGGGHGTPNATVAFAVTSGPNAGASGTAVTDGNGQASFTYTGAGQGEDLVTAKVTTVGSFSSNSTRVMWTNGSAAGWNGADIGGPTPAGGQAFDSSTGTWTIQGGGGGINGTADQLHLVSHTLSGAGGTGARVASLTNTNSSAQAGVMLRTSTDPGSPYYAAFVTPGKGITVQDRSSPGGQTATVVTQPGTAPAYLWVASNGTSLTAYSSSDGYVWNPVPGSTVALNLGSTVLAGLAVSSNNSGQIGTATADTTLVSASPPAPVPPVPCPTPWTCADIGNPALAGSQSYNTTTGTWTISAGGADISGTSDQFRFVSQPLAGDGSISAHVTSQTNSSSNAKAGVMFRAGTDPGAPNYAVLVSPGAGIKVQVRTTQGGTTTKLANPTGTVPAYLKVTRAGTTLSAYTSADGVTWTLIAGSTVTLNLGSSVLEGLAVTSHNTGTLCTVTMDSVQAS